jgi:hypothetical protein
MDRYPLAVIQDDVVVPPPPNLDQSRASLDTMS